MSSDLRNSFTTELRITIDNEEASKDLLFSLLQKNGFLDWVETCDPPYQELTLSFYDTGLDNYGGLGALQELIKVNLTDARLELAKYPNAVWQQAWMEGQTQFATDLFSVNSSNESADKISLCIEGKGAFGDGQHQTTRVLLSLMEKQCANAPSSELHNFLDLGTGTGILAIAAKKLGFENVFASDCDTEAIQSTISNAELNRVFLEVIHGSFPKDESIRFNRIVCNILSPELDRLMPEMVQKTKTHGKILIAGINEANLAPTMRVCLDLGLVELERMNSSGWVAIAFSKS